MQFQEQVAFVTGAGRGIGKAIALRFAREGADVALVDIDGESAEATSREIVALGRRAFVRTADVGDCEAIQPVIAEAATTLGRLDVLVNNAGIGRGKRLLEITRENWERHLRVHLSGSFYCAQAAAREMAHAALFLASPDSDRRRARGGRRIRRRRRLHGGEVPPPESRAVAARPPKGAASHDATLGHKMCPGQGPSGPA